MNMKTMKTEELGFLPTWRKDFDAERVKEEEAENSRRQMGSNRKNSSSPEADYPKGLIVAFTLKSMSSGDSAARNGSQEPVSDAVDVPKTDVEPDSTEIVTENADHEDAEDVEKKPIESIEEKSYGNVDEKNSLDSEEAEHEKKSLDSPLQKDEDKSTRTQKSSHDMFKDNKDVVLREDMKSVFQKFGTVKYVDFKMGADSGYIPFEEAEGAQKARAAAMLAVEGGLIVKNYVATLDPVTGEAEKEYWSMLRGNNEDIKFRGNKGNRGRGGKHNRGGRQFNGKHNRSRENESPNRPDKFQKVGAA